MGGSCGGRGVPPFCRGRRHPGLCQPASPTSTQWTACQTRLKAHAGATACAPTLTVLAWWGIHRTSRGDDGAVP